MQGGDEGLVDPAFHVDANARIVFGKADHPVAQPAGRRNRAEADDQPPALKPQFCGGCVAQAARIRHDLPCVFRDCFAQPRWRHATRAAFKQLSPEFRFKA